MKKLISQLNEIENLKQFSDKSAPEISEASVGWHLEHSLLVISKIIEGLKISKSENYQPRNNFAKIFVMTTGYIPRKKGKAPKITIPENDFNSENISKNIELVKTNLHHFNAFHPDSFIEHPYFGHLNVKEALKFLRIHTNHHLKIVKDILK